MSQPNGSSSFSFSFLPDSAVSFGSNDTTSNNKYPQIVQPSQQTHSAFPSPPPSDIDFDFESYTHCSPPLIPVDKSVQQHQSQGFVGGGGANPVIVTSSGELDEDPFNLDFSSLTTPSPTASAGISPKSTTTLTTPSISNANPFLLPSTFEGDEGSNGETDQSTLDAIALSNHHYQRYLHYKALADQAEAQLKASQSIQNDQIQAFLSSLSSMPPMADKAIHPPTVFNGQGNMNTTNMASFQPIMVPQPAPIQQPFVPAPQQSFSAMQPTTSYGYTAPHPAPMVPAPAVNNMSMDQANAQAQAHAAMQARDQALAQAAQHQRSASSVSMSTFPSSTRSSVDTSHAGTGMWTQSSSSTRSTTSPPFPSTPNYTNVPVPPMAMASVPVTIPAAAPVMVKSTSANTSTSLPTFATAAPASLPIRAPSLPDHIEGENELDDGESDNGDIDMKDEDIKPDINTTGLTNLHGGGRGYVPGKTPDDPKKRHKCQICGRGFARAFNLKSHIQTHNPLRSKPHMCPHPSCKRGFSRLHDLERHRQGIHSDGPLVDAKRQGVPPAVARAQGRIQRRSGNASLVNTKLSSSTTTSSSRTVTE